MKFSENRSNLPRQFICFRWLFLIYKQAPNPVHYTSWIQVESNSFTKNDSKYSMVLGIIYRLYIKLRSSVYSEYVEKIWVWAVKYDRWMRQQRVNKWDTNTKCTVKMLTKFVFIRQWLDSVLSFNFRHIIH